jgi:hypothetical protein
MRMPSESFSVAIWPSFSVRFSCIAIGGFAGARATTGMRRQIVGVGVAAVIFTRLVTPISQSPRLEVLQHGPDSGLLFIVHLIRVEVHEKDF